MGTNLYHFLLLHKNLNVQENEADLLVASIIHIHIYLTYGITCKLFVGKVSIYIHTYVA